MGVGYYQNLVQWSRGEYAGANNQEDDLAIIAGSAPYRLDDHPDTVAAAAGSPLVSSGAALAAAGVIERTGDADVFPFAAGAGAMSASAAPAAAGPDLDILLELLDAGGAVLASANPVGALAASLAYALPAAGTYFLRVSGAGEGDPAATGYSRYGSLGQYTLAGAVPPSAVASSGAPVTSTAVRVPGSSESPPRSTPPPPATTSAPGAGRSSSRAAVSTRAATSAPKTTPHPSTTAARGKKKGLRHLHAFPAEEAPAAGAAPAPAVRGPGGARAPIAAALGGAAALVGGLAAVWRRRPARAAAGIDSDDCAA